jgi:PqqD family protein of HPr-rel-A system
MAGGAGMTMEEPRKCKQAFVATMIDDETVLMHLETGEFFSLTDSAAAIWNALDKASSRAELMKLLTAEYDLPAAELEEDVDAFLTQLAEAGLIANG